MDRMDRSLLTSGKIARARAKLTIASDRLDCDPQAMQQMKKEITELLSRYIRTDEAAIEIYLRIAHRRKRGISDVKTIQIKGL